MKLLLRYAFKAAVLLMAAHFGSLFADNVLELRRLNALRDRARNEVTRLGRQNQAFLAEAQALDHDPFYVELTIRRKLRWVSPGQRPLFLVPPPAVCRTDPNSPTETERREMIDAPAVAWAREGPDVAVRR